MKHRLLSQSKPVFRWISVVWLIHVIGLNWLQIAGTLGMRELVNCLNLGWRRIVCRLGILNPVVLRKKRLLHLTHLLQLISKW